MKCEKCGKEHDGSFGSGRFCSKSCANSRGPRTYEFKRTVSQKLTIERKKKKCLLCNKEFIPKKKKQSFCSRDCARKHNIVCAKKAQITSPPDWSLIHREAYKKGNNFIAGGTTKWYSYKDIMVQGTYELRMCYILDKMIDLEEISSWDYTNDRIEYESIDKKKRNYLLDFKVFDNNGFYYIEVKGYAQENDFLKWKSVRDKGFDLRVFYDNEIKIQEKRLGLL